MCAHYSMYSVYSMYSLYSMYSVYSMCSVYSIGLREVSLPFNGVGDAGAEVLALALHARVEYIMHCV